METVIKSFLGLYFLLLLCLIGAGFMGISVRTRLADAYLADIIVRIEEGHYQKNIIEDCQAEAAENGYKLDVYPKGGAAGYRGRAILTYTVGIPLLGFARKQAITVQLR